jgi:predicted flap endonuclease-1-like 5' DNA nuclease
MKQKVNFTLPQHIVGDAISGIILGDFNNWNADAGIVLEKTEDGSFTASVLLEPGQTYQYRYFLDNYRWENDDRAHYYASSGLNVENCVVVVTESTEETATEEPEETVTEKTEEAVAPAAPKATAKASKPKAAVKAAKPKPEVPKDELVKIEGISKPVAALLQENGIATFAQLSKASVKKLKEILDAAGPKYSTINPAAWPKQAKLAAAGKWEELDALKAAAKGGK